MVDRGSQLANCVVNVAWATWPRRNPAKVFPVRGAATPFGCRPAVMPANEKAPLG